MKKILAMCAVALAVCGAFAALRTGGKTAIAIAPPATVSAGATTTNAYVAVSGLRGMGEVVFCANAVAAASSNRTVTVTLYGADATNGEWRVIGAGSYKGAAAGVARVPFRGEYLPPYIRTTVGNTTASSVVSAVLLSN